MDKQRAAIEIMRRAFNLFCDRWTLLILQSIFFRIRRYQDIRERLGISPTTLSERLSSMVEAGILKRTPYQGSNRTRLEYRLTPRGLELWQLLVSIWFWEKRWVDGRAAELPGLTHLDCGQSIIPEMACAACGEATQVRDVLAEFTSGPALSRITGTRQSPRVSANSPVNTDPLMFFRVAMAVLGDRWCIALVGCSMIGIRRFSDFQRQLGIGPSVLAGRLRKLIGLGVFAMGTSRDPSAYRLTPAGQALFVPLAFMLDWMQPEPVSGPPALVRMRHRGPNHHFHPAFRCPVCGGELRRDNTRIDPPTVVPDA